MITFEKRRDLKRSADEGAVNVFDIIRKTTRRSISDVLNGEDDYETLTLLEKSPELGSGTYGEAKEVSKDVVCKITGCGSYLLAPVHSVWRSENVEPRLIQFLWKHLVETRITPHIIAPLGLTHSIIEGATKKQKNLDNTVENSLIYFMEKATAGTVRSFFKRASAIGFDSVFLVILFQICYTLEAIYMRFPRFRHNDLKDDNIFLHKSTAQGYTVYTIHGTTFTVPNVGVTVLISDFDFACISGESFDNFKVIEQEWETPSYHINTRIDHAADLGCFMSYVRNQFTDKLSKKTRNKIALLFGESKKNNNYHTSPKESGGLPDVKEVLLNTNLFAEFVAPRRLEGMEVTEIFNADVDISVDYPVQENDTRHCPVFLPRTNKVIDPSDLISFEMFAAWPLSLYVPQTLDEEEPDDLSQGDVHRLIEKMKSLYEIKPNPKLDLAGFGFPVVKKDLFFETVEQIGNSFIMDYYVPSRWWPAVYTCAFVDAIEEMDLCISNQVCWHFSQWCEFWKKQDEAEYTEMQMLHFALQWGWVRE